MKTKYKPSAKRIILLFIVYTLLFITLFFFLDYYDYYIINPYLLIVLSVILGVILTYIHIKNRKRSRIDDIVEKL
jgi:undecaprenyl pyrophosphate phosphatase UppP